MTDQTPASASRASTHGLDLHGLRPRGTVHWNLSPAELYEAALRREEGRIAHGGGFASVTAPHTGRSPNDKFTVQDDVSAESVDWGSVNVPLDPGKFAALKAHVLSHLDEQDELFVRDARAGADPSHGINVRVVNTHAWHNLFAHNMFLRPAVRDLADMKPDFTVLHAPELAADPEIHGTRSRTGIVVSLAERTVLILGTRYAGEIRAL